MNDQPNFSNFGPPPVTGWARLTPYLKTAAAGGLLVTTSLFALQVFLPEGWRPADIAGDAAGSTVKHEILAKQEAQLEFERRLADATAQANAKAQMDLAAIQTVLAERTASLEPVSRMAGVTDAACLFGNIVASFTTPSGNIGADWRHPDTGSDWHNGAVAVAQSTCGVGDHLRSGVSASQLDSVRTAAAARGVSMTNGAVQPIPMAPAEPLPQPAIRVAEALPAPKAWPSKWSAVQQGRLRGYSYGLPVDVLNRIVSGLDVTGGYPDAWYDRVADYQAAHHG